MARYLIAAITPLFNSVTAIHSETLHRGWGESIQWHNLNDGLRKAQSEGKNLMVIIHLMTCPACVRSKYWFSRSKGVAEHSRKFVMVNVEPNEIPGLMKKELAPDGHYVPRFVFMSPNGHTLRGIRTRHPEYGYIYEDEGTLITNMKKLTGGYGDS